MHETSGHGHGVTRLLGERVPWFKFETSIGPSHAGDFDAVHLDYGHDHNPPLVRKVKDEVREVAPGLWLGLAYMTMREDRKSTRLNSSHSQISYAVFCLKKKKESQTLDTR